METLNSMYSKTYNFVYLRAKCIFKKEEDVQQLMKEVYVANMDKEVSDERLYSLLGKKVYSLGSAKFRKKKVSESAIVEIDEEECYVAPNVDIEKTKAIICKALDELPDMYLATLCAFYYDHIRIKEISQLMGYGVKAILYRLNYGHKYLKKTLESYSQSYNINVRFSVEAMTLAMEEWAQKNVMDQNVAFNTLGKICREIGIQTEATCEEEPWAGLEKHIVEYEDGCVTALWDELLSYQKKEKNTNVWKWVLGIAGSLILVAAVILLIVFGINKGKDEKKEQEPTPTPVVEQQEEIQEETVDESEYVLPNSDTVKYTREQLQDMSPEQLRLARNEIFARYGVYFNVSELDDYFRSKSWYSAKMSLTEFYESVEKMNEAESANLSLIQQIEAEKAK